MSLDDYCSLLPPTSSFFCFFLLWSSRCQGQSCRGRNHCAGAQRHFLHPCRSRDVFVCIDAGFGEWVLMQRRQSGQEDLKDIAFARKAAGIPNH